MADDFKRNIAVLKHTARLHHYKKTTTLSVGWRILGVFDIMSAATLDKKHMHRPMCVHVRFVVVVPGILVPVQLFNGVCLRERVGGRTGSCLTHVNKRIFGEMFTFDTIALLPGTGTRYFCQSYGVLGVLPISTLDFDFNFWHDRITFCESFILYRTSYILTLFYSSPEHNIPASSSI